MQMPIRSLQSMLRLLQRHAGKPTTVVPDGIFGPETARAVREFQQQNGLPVTGAADLTTWNAVVDAAREAHIHHGPAEPLRPLFQPMQTISPGEQNMHLYLAQGMLQALRHYYDGMPPVSVTGRHDEACTACLKWLQARCGAVIARSKAPRAAVDIGIHALAEHRRKQEFSAARGQKVPNECLGRSAAAAAVLPQEGDIVILAGQAILPAAAGVGPVAEQHIPAQNDAAHCLDAGKHPKDLRLCPGQLSARKLYRPAEGAQIPTHILSPSRFPIHRESRIAARIRRYF